MNWITFNMFAFSTYLCPPELDNSSTRAHLQNGGMIAVVGGEASLRANEGDAAIVEKLTHDNDCRANCQPNVEFLRSMLQLLLDSLQLHVDGFIQTILCVDEGEPCEIRGIAKRNDSKMNEWMKILNIFVFSSLVFCYTPWYRIFLNFN